LLLDIAIPVLIDALTPHSAMNIIIIVIVVVAIIVIPEG
jgi:hypothetical protein